MSCSCHISVLVDPSIVLYWVHLLDHFVETSAVVCVVLFGEHNLKLVPANRQFGDCSHVRYHVLGRKWQPNWNPLFDNVLFYNQREWASVRISITASYHPRWTSKKVGYNFCKISNRADSSQCLTRGKAFRVTLEMWTIGKPEYWILKILGELIATVSKQLILCKKLQVPVKLGSVCPQSSSFRLIFRQPWPSLE